MASFLEVFNKVIDSMKEAAELSIIHPGMLDEIEELRTNGGNARDLFGIPMCEFVSNRFDKCPLDQRINWFNSLA